METTQTTGIEKPGGIKLTPDEPVIHVIPEKFFQVGLKKSVKAEPAKPAVPPSPVSPSAQETPAVAPQPPKPAAKPFPVFALVAVIAVLLLGGAGAAYYFLVFRKPAVQPPTNVATNTDQTPQPTCGDGRCDLGETADVCAADCRVTPPVNEEPKTTCGDGRCDLGETADVCAADCQPAPPKSSCGDGRCDSDETEQGCAADCQAVSGLDSDYDGVSDVEERGVYGTDPNDTDSDKDGFVDLNEIVNQYDPANAVPKSPLSGNQLIATHENKILNYSVLRPRDWTEAAGDAANGGMIFTAPSGEFLQVMAVDKPTDKSLMDWFLTQQPDVKSSDVQIFKTKQGYDEVLSPDRMTAYVAVGDKAFVISYDLGEQKALNFRTTFQMMVNSLKVQR